MNVNVLSYEFTHGIIAEKTRLQQLIKIIVLQFPQKIYHKQD